MYKKINIQLMIRQYLGINNIILFDRLDNKNGIEYNDFLDKQIEASAFWTDLFLDTKNYTKLTKYVKNYKYFEQKPSFHTEDIDNREPENISLAETESESESKPESELKSKPELSRNKVTKAKTNGYVKSDTKTTKSKEKSDSKKTKSTKTKKKPSQKGGTMEIDYLNQTITYSDDNTLDSLELEENMGRLESNDDLEDGYIDLNNLSIK